MVAALERKRQRKRGERNGLSLSCRVSHEGIRVPVEKKKKRDRRRQGNSSRG